MAFQTRSASAGATVEMPLTARETVAIETPARWATSRMLALGARSRFVFFLGPPTDARILRHFLVFHEDVSAGWAARSDAYEEVRGALAPFEQLAYLRTTT
jgi:hypothetical protein